MGYILAEPIGHQRAELLCQSPNSEKLRSKLDRGESNPCSKVQNHQKNIMDWTSADKINDTKSKHCPFSHHI